MVWKNCGVGCCVAGLGIVGPETIRYRLDFLESILPGNKRLHERVRQVRERPPGAGQPIVADSWVARVASMLRIGGFQVKALADST